MSTEAREVRAKRKTDKKSISAIAVELEIPGNVNVKIDKNILEVSGPKGKVSKDLNKIPVNVEVEGKNVRIKPYGRRKKDLSITNTTRSIIRNMIDGVLNGYTYKLKIVYAHFPISVKVKDGYIFVENFLGERAPRKVEIIGDCKAGMQGEDLAIQGPSLEDVSQTAANAELATRIKDKDLRVFLDGLYIYSREKGM